MANTYFRLDRDLHRDDVETVFGAFPSDSQVTCWGRELVVTVGSAAAVRTVLESNGYVVTTLASESDLRNQAAKATFMRV